MFSPKSPKSQKLIQFRDKLSKLSSKHETSLEIQKLEQLQLQNKKFELEISLTFDQISNYYQKSEERVRSQFQTLIQSLNKQHSQIVGMLTYFKQKQLQEVKQCGDQFIKFQKLIRDKIRQLDSSPHNNQLHEQIGGLKPFDLRKLHRKMEDMTFNRATLERNIEQFQSYKDMFTLIHKEDFSNFYHQQNNKQISQNQIKQLKISNISKNFNQKIELETDQQIDNKNKTNKKMLRQFTENQSQDQKNEGHANKLNELLFQRKTQQKQQNLMEQESCARSPKHEVRRQLKYMKSYDQEDMQQKTQKVANISKREGDSRKSERKDSDRSNADSKVRKNLDTFLHQLKRSHIGGTSSRQDQKLQYKSKLHKLTRVKSQQNMIYSKARMTPPQVEMNVESTQAYVKINQNISIRNSMRASKNTFRDSKAGKRGDWASILKEQQTKYNQMRKKLKN